MIKSQDLRINNWVHANTPVMQVKEIYEHSVGLYMPGSESDNFNYPVEQLQGIPLTPLILEKCGFTKSSNGPYFDKYRLPNGYRIAHCVENTNTDAEGRPYHTKGFYCGATDREIKYLHRLQNLIYEICDYEINYTP